jgi:phosphoglycerol transferase MdoB-like AlkP superfamily enzyme
VKPILSIIKQYIFWLLLFALTRAVFYIYYQGIIFQENIPATEIISSFWHALPLDISTASYILVFPFLLLTIQSAVFIRGIDSVIKVYTFIMIALFVLITVGELGIYEEWKTKLQFKALKYLSNPEEIYDSADTGSFILLVVILFTEIIFFSWLYRKYFFTKVLYPVRSFLFTFLFLVIGSGVVFFGIRGGLSEIPITQSKSYFSKYNFVNLGSINSGYSLLFSTIENYQFRNENPFSFYNPDVATERVSKLNSVDSDTTISILKTNRPNIVIILLESWSADLIESLDGKPGITPEFNKLEKNGLLFTKLYASGNRSEQAMTSIFAGFPSTPITAISHSLDKIAKLPSLTKLLIKNGYSTSFLFGGELMYGGISSFISVNGFENIREGKDFSSDLPRGKLGIHDEFMFNEQVKLIDSKEEPFFSVLFTLSTHSPYDQPMEDVISCTNSKNQNGYLNSAYYTDKCLGEYFEEVKTKPWYSNTLFILVADHSHGTYKHWPVHNRNYRRVPMLFYGDVLKDEYKGKTIDRLSSQTDLTSTLLAQLNIRSDEFPWSKNLFNPSTPDFVFYESTDGVGWVTPNGYFVYSRTIDDFMEIDIAPEQYTDSIVTDGKSYLQVLFREFMDY